MKSSPSAFPLCWTSFGVNGGSDTTSGGVTFFVHSPQAQSVYDLLWRHHPREYFCQIQFQLLGKCIAACHQEFEDHGNHAEDGTTTESLLLGIITAELSSDSAAGAVALSSRPAQPRPAPSTRSRGSWQATRGASRRPRSCRRYSRTSTEAG